MRHWWRPQYPAAAPNSRHSLQSKVAKCRLQGAPKECADGKMAWNRGAMKQMTMKGKNISDEARTLERVVSAAREVQAASLRLEAHYARDSEGQPTTLELARFAAAMQELKDAREAFDALVAKRDACST